MLTWVKQQQEKKTILDDLLMMNTCHASKSGMQIMSNESIWVENQPKNLPIIVCVYIYNIRCQQSILNVFNDEFQ